MPPPPHEQTFAAQYMAQQIQNMNSGVVGNTFVKVWKDRIHKSRRSNFPDPTIDEIVRSQISHQASIPMSRQPTQRHILEVSAAQQRQQDVLTQARRHQPAYPVTGRLCYRHKLAIRRDQINPNLVLIQDSLTHTFILQGDKSGNSIRQHPNPFDEQYTHAKNSRPRAHVPETSFNNYEPLDNHKKPPPPPEEHLPPSQGDATEETTAKEEPVMEEEEEIDHRKHGHKGKHKEKGGRKSRMVEETNVLYQFSQEKRVPSYVPTCVQESINPIELALEKKFSVVIPQENNVPFLTTREIKNPGREIKNLGRLILRRGSIQDRSTFQRNCFPQFKSDLRKSFEVFSSFTGIEAFLNWVPAFRADISLSLLTVDAF
ncbi:uncharacterized protein LOC128168896 isoform X2 [Crassostrea angulata]|uniref:uncharacterized protein LOC128168896 isoform X2 n=1 Tax=Magallana angulata TaxID=2784310 RepID=UPI0022B13E73|nr:uncharacterized protein LOC128168896 isoform X2 [Crassostrea angulata]